MSNYDEITVIGRLTTHMKMLKSKSGKSFATVSVAVNKRFMADSDTKETVKWYTLILNNKLVDMAEKRFHVGELLFVSGIPQVNAWIKDGKAQAKIDIIVKEVVFLSPKAKEKLTETEPTEISE